MKNNILFISTILILTIINVIMMYIYGQYCTFSGDDAWFSLYQENESIFRCLNPNYGHGAGYIGVFLNKIFSFALPATIGIHPQDFMSLQHNIIKGIFTTIILLSITQFLNFYVRNRNFSILLFSFLIGYFFYFAMGTCVIEVNYSFYRYFFSLLFFSIFWYFIFKNIIKTKTETSRKKLIIASICGYIVGTSIEISFFASAFLCCLLIGHNLITSKLFKSLKYNLDKNFYIPSVFLFLGIFLFTNSEGFKSVANDRGMNNIHIDIATLKEFWSTYYQIYFQEMYIYWITFFILLVTSLYFAIRKNELKNVIFPILLQFSILTVIFSLILCGKNSTFTDGNLFFLQHCNIIFLYKMLILYPAIIYASYILKNIQIQIDKIEKFLIPIFLIILISLCISKYSFFVKMYDEYIDRYLKIKQSAYICEKMLRFYAIQGKTAIVDKKMLEAYFINWYFPNTQEINYTDSPIINTYYPRIYRDETIKTTGFQIEENAIETFKQNGGSISDKELKDLNFSHLYDEKFVLNKEEEG